MLHIVTLNWNASETIGILYNSLIPALSFLNGDWVWHIRDNNSTDNSVDSIKKWNNDKVNLIQYGSNSESYAKGMNFLFDQTNANNNDYILHLNNDIVFKDNTSIKKMMDILKKDNDVGQVGAKLNYVDSNKIQHCGVVFSKQHCLPKHLKDLQEETNVERQNRYMPAITGAVALQRADILKEVRLNDRYFWAFEDIDISLQINYNLNKKIVYCGETNIFHHSSQSLKKNPMNKLFLKANANLFRDLWAKEIVKRGDLTSEEQYSNSNYRLYK